MSGSQRGNHLGPFKLEQRYRHTEDLGRVYRARNTETGAPALVLRPMGRDPESTPLADWRLRLFSSVSPAYLALEVEAAPEAANAPDAGEELEAMLEDLLEAVMHTNARPETLGHLRSPRRLPPPPTLRKPVRRWLQPALGSVMAAAFAGLLLFAGTSELTPAEDWALRPELAQARNDGGWGGAGDLTVAAFTGVADFEPFVLARPMPKKPFDIQKRPPCKKTLEEEHFGGCWVPHEVRAPCPDELYEMGGKCYVPAVQAPPPPSSIFR